MKGSATTATFLALGLCALIGLSACSDDPVISQRALNAADGQGGFRKVPASETGITFVNEVRPEHVLPYLYNGCGVATGDLDGDSLPEVFLVSQDGPNRLYRNLGDLRFEDVTDAAGVADGDAWGVGCSFVDIDQDGDLDIYVCNTETPNRLFRNLGGMRFKECAAEVGVAFVGASTMPAFADYDNDGDLDLYLVTNRVLAPTIFRPLLGEITPPKGFAKSIESLVPTLEGVERRGDSYFIPEHLRDHVFELVGKIYYGGQSDRLLRNDGGKFTDATAGSGIHDQSMGLSATWFDFDQDGLLDLYVANDLESPDRLYRNAGNGRFVDVTEERLPNLPYFGMGSDAGDVNNDGRLDVIVADMAMRTHYKAKVLMGDMGERSEVLQKARPPQIMRNSLFLNVGSTRFLESAWQSHVAKTDWTWAVKFGDLDLDGRLDLFATNGIPRFDNDPDLQIRFSEAWRAGRAREAMDMARNVAAVPEPNVVMLNRGGMIPRFENDPAWTPTDPSVSHGASFCDLDLDGDLDLVVNEYRAVASVLENRAEGGGRVTIRLRGTDSDSHGIGARLDAFAGDLRMTRQLKLSGGYLSSDEPLVHFGLGQHAAIDRLEIRWPSGRLQVLEGLQAGFRHEITESGERATVRNEVIPSLFEAANRTDLGEAHEEMPFDDYADQPLLPHKHSQLGPGIAVGDVDGDGTDDVWIGGAAGQPGRLLRQTENGFRRVGGPWMGDADSEDLGALLFDADGDGDTDLYVVSGSVETDPAARQDRLYLNDGNARFQKSTGALPEATHSGSVVVAADIDGDRDLDLFVGGRVVPGRYPRPATSQLLINDGGRFTDATPEPLQTLGLVTSALFTHLNDDEHIDLLIVGHWMHPHAFLNDGAGQFRDASQELGFLGSGWWNGVAGGDVDGDGDIDYVTTNLGTNTKYAASLEEPARVFCSDFDSNGTLDVVEAKQNGATILPVRGRSCSSAAIPMLGERFPTFDSFAKASLQEIYTPDQLDAATEFRVTELRHTLWVRGDDGTFSSRPLPDEAQIAPAFGVVVRDLDGDGFDDVQVAHNFFTSEPETGRMAGGLSCLMRGSADGLSAMEPTASGVALTGDQMALAVLDLDDDQRPDLLFSQNDGPARAFRNVTGRDAVTVRIEAIGARITFERADGTRQAAELHAGGGYLSQSASTCSFGNAANGGVLVVRWPDGATTRHPVNGPGRIELRR